MAPTEILAEQHLRQVLAAGWRRWASTVAWLTGSLTRKDKREALARVARGEAAVAVGTHALFQEQVEFQRLGLAIVDEQHRFGVHQRLALAPEGDRRWRGRAAASADDERHADSAHAGHELLRRSRRVGDRRAAAGTHAGGHQAGVRRAPRRGDRARARRLHGRAPGLLGVPADRGVRGAAAADRDRDLRDAHADLPGARGGSGARAPEQQREGRRDGAVQRRCDPAAGGHHRDRGRRGRAATPR